MTILAIIHEATARAVEPTTAVFLRHKAFLNILREKAGVALETTRLVSERYFTLRDELKIVGLSGRAQRKLAAFLLELSRLGSCPKENCDRNHSQKMVNVIESCDL